MVRTSILIVILGVMALSIGVFATDAEATGIAWRAINKASSVLNDIGTPIASYSFNNQRITSLGTPTASTDAARANTLQIGKTLAVGTCADGSPLEYQSSNSTWICGTDASGGGNHNLLSATHSDTTPGTVVRGDLIVGSSTPTWTRLAVGTTGEILRVNSAGDIVWVKPCNKDYQIASDETTFAWTNKASALQEILNTNRYRNQVDLTGCTQFRIVTFVATAGTAGSVTGVQYSTDGGTNWNGLDNGSTGSLSTVTNSDAATGLIVSTWTNLAAGAKADVQLRLAGSGGDGVADPAFGTMEIQFRYNG